MNHATATSKCRRSESRNPEIPKWDFGILEKWNQLFYQTKTSGNCNLILTNQLQYQQLRIGLRALHKLHRQEDIPPKARALAESGTCDRFLKIVLKLRNEGYSDALQVLDNLKMRDELNSTCRIAQSETETNNRDLYVTWLGTIPNIAERIWKDLEALPSLYGGTLSITDADFNVVIKKKFNSDELQAHIEIEVSRDRSIGFSPPVDLGVHLSELKSDDQSFEAIEGAVRIGRSYRDAVGRDMFTGRIKK